MIVTGDDNFAIELSRDKYLKRIKALHGQCTVEIFDAADERVDEFMSRAMTASLFQEIRVYCVLHAQSLTEKDLAALDRALDYEIPDVYVFIAAETEKKSAAETKISKALRFKKRGDDKSVSIKDCSKPPDYKLAEWIVEQVPLMFDRYIGTAEAEFLAKTVEYDLLYSELQKIDVALEPGARIDKDVIREIVGATRTMTVFELAAALGKKDLPAALTVLDSLFNSAAFSAPLAVSTVFRHFWAMLKIKKFLKRNPSILKQFNTRGFGNDSPQSMAAAEIGIAAGLLTEKTRNRVFPMIIKSGIVQQAQSFSEKGLRDIIGMLQRFDVDVKTGKAEPVSGSLQMLCYRIARAA
jgi:DNA polymerase III delta subunit